MKKEASLLSRQIEDLKAEVAKLRSGEDEAVYPSSIVHDITDRVQAQQQLTESERRLSTLMANLPGMAYRCLNDASWTMKFISEGCLALTGFVSDHLLGNQRTSYAELIHPSDRQAVWDQVQRSLQNRSQFNLTYRIHTAGGQEKWVMEIGQGIFSDTGDLLAIEGFITDITERRRSEEALRQSEEKFRLAFQTSPDAINLNRLSDGMYVDINEGFTCLTGYTRDDAIGKTSRELNIWADPADRERLVNGLRSKGTVENLEARFRRKNGGVGVGLMSARVLHLNQEDVILSITRDITERKQVEDALRESQDRYHQLFDASTDAILVRTGETITHANSAAQKLFRAQSAGDLVGKCYLDFVYPDDRPESAERIRKSMGGDWMVPPREHRLVTLDGQVIHVESAGVPIKYQGKIQHFGMFRDITDRKKAEERLRESEKQYRQLVEASTDAILVRSGDVIVYANPAAVRLFRASDPKEIAGKSYLGFVHPDDRPESIERIKKGLNDRWIAPPREHRMVALDGQVLNVESTGVPIQHKGEPQLFGVFRDISERKQIDEKLRETEKKYRELAESLPQVIFEVDSKGDLVYLNQTGFALFGYTPGDLARGFNVLEAFVPEDRERIASDIILNVQGQKSGRQEYTAVKKDGTKFPVGVHANRVMREQTATGVRGILIDFTPTKRAEEEKKKLEIQLQQAQKMEAIGALAGGIAHDFNNILSAIIGYTELAMLNEGAEHCSVELNEALIAANRAKDLVKQILAFSRQTEEERMPVRVALVAREAVKFLRATIPTTIEIKSRIDDKSGAVLANSVELHQIIMNLCTNAQHAIGDQGGLLEVAVQNTEIDLSQKNDLIDLEIGPYVRISVKDTGNGMPPDVIKRIFDPYFTTKEKGVGTGLGLAVVHGIVKKYDGTIKVESEPGKGTTFHIYLPKVDIAAPSKKEPPKPLVGGSERILFVDDEKMIVDIGQQALQRLGYDVVSRTSPIEALELFKAKPDFFDLVITDKTMPGMTGDALAKELMHLRPTLPVIICTGYSQAVDNERAKKIGIKAFVMKPILINELASAVRKVLDKE
jgi:PAS domain S-box-containing protein